MECKSCIVAVIVLVAVCRYNTMMLIIRALVPIADGSLSSGLLRHHPLLLVVFEQRNGM